MPSASIDLMTRNRILLITLGGIFLLMLGAAASLLIPYERLARGIDQQLAAGPFVRTFSFYSSPEIISQGDHLTPDDLAAALKRCGAVFVTGKDVVEIKAQLEGQGPVTVQFEKGVVKTITDRNTGLNQKEFLVPEQLITNLSDEGREKRVMVKYSDLPPVLINAIVSAEDKRFFQHAGFDPFRIAKAAYVDFREKRKEQGASTITMQLARNLYLDRDKRWRRKVAELMISIHLEHKLTKQELLQYYCNQVYLGGRGTYSINGFGEAARAFFNKDVRRLSLPEAALLAGLIQRPSYFNPFRYPDRAQERRDLVLKMMLENKYINQQQYEKASAAPVTLEPPSGEMNGAQYYLDLASDEVQKDLQDREWHGVASVYTNLDFRLQQAAEKAVKDGMQKVDRLIKSSGKAKKGADMPQVALIALDPHTGEIKALVGGRNYSTSQLDRVLAKRPPGSVFKPFVYAAAMSTAVDRAPKVFTAATTVMDAPTVFKYASQTYSPDNFEHQFHGQVTLREALAKSMNVATVRLAEMTGYDEVVRLAKEAGMREEIQPTPAVALGAYGVTPLEIAGAYTIFANRGMRERPVLIDSVREKSGESVYNAGSAGRRVLDPRVAYLMVDMLGEVLRSGTGAGIHSMGFQLPAVGKTGTSHDGWFAGFTDGLLCVVWVGYDDYRELDLEGARSAMPIWAEFMMEAASRVKRYRDVKPFPVPAGLVRVTVDATTGQLATPDCEWTDTSYFIAGTQPNVSCALHGQDQPIRVENVAAGQ